MANEPLALAIEPEAPSEDDYRAFCAALSETARGRAFLAEYARRQRAADTGMLLAALERLEGLVRSHAAPPALPPADTVREELLALLDGIREMQAEIDAGGLTMQVAKLASLIEVVQQRIEAIVLPERDDAAAEDLTSIRHAEVATEGGPRRATAEADHPSRLASLAPTDDGESAERDSGIAPADAAVEAMSDEPAAQAMPPEPSAEPAQPAAIAQAAQSTAIPEVAWFDGPPPAARPTLAIAAVVEAAATAAAAAEPQAPKVTVFKAGTIPPPTPFAGEDFSRPQRAVNSTPPADPLAPIAALSEDERLALFA